MRTPLRVILSDGELTGDDDATRLTGDDDDPGVPPEELAVLEDGGETPLRRSSGLGLWLITWIVTESAGTVTFRESDLGGTVVDIRLRRGRAGQRTGLD
jgi:sensor histidine kinase regulating citrate/malate metabolism